MTSRAPYPGLRPFQQGESDIFFGRSEHVDELLVRLERSRFLSVVGPSGSGKSSLVRAGLLDALESGFMASAGAGWRVVALRPGAHPMLRLAEALLTSSRSERHESDAALLKASLERRRGSFVDCLREQRLLTRGDNLIVLVDQFEELFRFGAAQSPDEAERFVALLVSAVEQKEAPVYVVLTMRSDYIGDCAAFPGLAEAVNSAQFLTPRLTREQSREAIVRPARVFGSEVESALVNRLLNDMGDAPDQLPLMQHVLMRLWSRKSNAAARESNGTCTLSVVDYEAAGGLERALSKHAKDVYDKLSARDQRAAQVLFSMLSEQGADRRDARRPMELGKVVQIAAGRGSGDWREPVQSAAAAFRRPECSFITPPEPAPLKDTTFLDISHECLIRQWDLLRGWAQQEADDAETYRELLPPAGRWKARRGRRWSALGDLSRGWSLRRARSLRRRMNASWAALYGGSFRTVERFIRASVLYWALRTTLVVGAVLAVVGAYLIYQQRELRSAALQTKELFDSQLMRASLLARAEDYAAAKDALAETRSLDSRIPAERRRARDMLASFAEIRGGGPQRTYETGAGPLYTVAVSPDGRLLAAVGEKGAVVLLHAETGEILQHLEGHEDDVNDAVFDPDGAWLATGADDGKIIRWSLPGDGAPAEQLQVLETPGEVWALAVTPDGEILASGGTDFDVTLWHLETDATPRRLEGHTGPISESSGLAFSPSGELLASGSYDDAARIWNVATGESLHELVGHSGDVDGVAFTPDGSQLCTSGEDKRLILWDVESGARLRAFDGHRSFVFGVASVPRRAAGASSAEPPQDAPLVVSSSRDGTLRVWDTASGETLRVLQGHQASAHGIAATTGPDGAARIFSAGADGAVIRWDTSLPRQWLLDLPGEPSAVAISPLGRHVAVGSQSGAVRVYSLPEGELREEAQEHARRVSSLAFNPAGTLLGSGSADETARIWSVSAEGRLEAKQALGDHEGRVGSVAFSPDGGTLATASNDGRVRLFAVDSGEGEPFEAHPSRVVSVNFDATGTRLLTAGYDDRTAYLWDLGSSPPARLRQLPQPNAELISAALSPDGGSAVQVGRDSLVHVFSLPELNLLHRFVGHEQTIFRAIFGPDGRQLATLSSDRTIRLWDLTADAALFTQVLPSPTAPPVPAYDFDFRCTPTGCWIAAPLARGKLALYDFGHLAGASQTPH